MIGMILPCPVSSSFLIFLLSGSWWDSFLYGVTPSSPPPACASFLKDGVKREDRREHRRREALSKAGVATGPWFSLFSISWRVGELSFLNCPELRSGVTLNFRVLGVKEAMVISLEEWWGV